MKNDSVLRSALIFIVLFNIIFWGITVFYYDIVSLPGSIFDDLNREKLDWYMNRTPIPHENTVSFVANMSNFIFPLMFLGFFSYILFEQRYKEINTTRILVFVIFGFTILSLIFAYMKYELEYYRLFMQLIPSEIFSLVLLFTILNIRKQI